MKMFKKSIIWTNFTDGKTIYDIFKDYGIDSSVKRYEKIAYVRFDECGTCQFRWSPIDSTVENERDVYEYWIKDEGYTELKMFEEDKEYVGTI